MTMELFKQILYEENLILQTFMVKHLILNKLWIKYDDEEYIIEKFIILNDKVKLDPGENVSFYITLNKNEYHSHYIVQVQLENKYYLINDLKEQWKK
jgi:hypothetical protein